MKKYPFLLLLLIFVIGLNGCGPITSPMGSTEIPSTPSDSNLQSTPAILVTPTHTIVPKGKTIIVTNNEDSGPGSLRQALLDAQPGDIITFDTTVFPPSSPEKIVLSSCLPAIKQGHLTLDASDAGVILVGQNVISGWCAGFRLVSNGNIVRGFRFEEFSPGAGVALAENAQHNVVGGDPDLGDGPQGQGNVVGYGDVGISIGGRETSYNKITGNFIGVDPDGRDLNQVSVGIWIEDGSVHNTIGPGNVIAYNFVGIEVHGMTTTGNRITANSIYSNDRGGISLPDLEEQPDENSDLVPPIIMSHDLKAGLVTGLSCPDCTIEIFSGDNNQANFFEGSCTADEHGGFTYQKNVQFAGKHITATATDKRDMTSSFALATQGNENTLDFQKNNRLPVSKIILQESKILKDNRIGTMLTPDESGLAWPDADTFLYEVNKIGFKRIRLSVDYIDLEKVNWNRTYSTQSIESSFDTVIDRLIEDNIKITHCITFWDRESPGQSMTPGYFRFETEDEIQRYLDYVRFIVGHFKDRIEYYEILNEPISGSGTQQSVKVEDYITLVNRVVPVIRAVDPKAKIIVGAIPNLYEPQDYEYLMRILNSEIISEVDAISFHPMHGVSPDYEHQDDYYKYPSVIKEIKDVASAHGFKGEYMADELVWRTPENPLPSEPWIYTEIVAAKYYARGITTQLGLGLNTGITELDLNLHSRMRPIGKVIQNLANLMAGTEPQSLSITILSKVKNIRYYGFSLPDGDVSLALWSDDKAKDDTSAIPSKITVPGFANWNAIAADVLNGLQQPLNTTSEDGDLIIQDFLLKDYPIVIRLTK